MSDEDQIRALVAAWMDATREGKPEKVLELMTDDVVMWTKLTVVAAPPDGGAPTKRAGHTLTVLRRENGRWKLARDANLLAPAP